MIKIESLQGLESRLYQVIAPLTMNPRVLRYNNNYPFKTSKNFIWYVAWEDTDDTVVGFVPVEMKEVQAVLNNYYVAGDNPEIFTDLLIAIKAALGEHYVLEAVVQTPHIDVFEKNGFNTVREWKKYVKMEWSYDTAQERL
ncbi:MAG: hypothetical protein J1E02_08365 [Coprobacter sp.]|nr:hypothetical protein [Coprobacter sp.]